MAADRRRWRVSTVAVATLLSLPAHPAASRTPWVLVRDVGGQTRVTADGGAPGSVLVFPLPTPLTPDAVRTDPAALRVVADAEVASRPRLAISADADPCFPDRPSVAIRAPADPRGAARPDDQSPAPVPSDQPASAAGYAVRILTQADARRGRLGLPAALPPQQVAAVRNLLRHGQSLAMIQADGGRTHDPVSVAMPGSRILLPWTLQPGAGARDMFALTATGGVRPIAGLAPVATLEVGAVPEYLADDPAPFTAAVLAGAGGTAPMKLFAAPFAPDPALFLTRLRLPQAEPQALLRTRDTVPFQPLYTLRTGWKGQDTIACTAGYDYRIALAHRWQDESGRLARLTGWQPAAIRAAMVAHWNRAREKLPD